MMGTKNEILNSMRAKWASAMVSRSEIGAFTGGMLSAGTMANLDSRGESPAIRVKMGARKVAYPVDSLLEWLGKRMEIIENKGSL